MIVKSPEDPKDVAQNRGRVDIYAFAHVITAFFLADVIVERVIEKRSNEPMQKLSKERIQLNFHNLTDPRA